MKYDKIVLKIIVFKIRWNNCQGKDNKTRGTDAPLLLHKSKRYNLARDNIFLWNFQCSDTYRDWVFTRSRSLSIRQSFLIYKTKDENWAHLVRSKWESCDFSHGSTSNITALFYCNRIGFVSQSITNSRKKTS